MSGAVRNGRPTLPVKGHVIFEMHGHFQQEWRGVKSLGFLASSKQFKNVLFPTDDYGATDYK